MLKTIKLAQWFLIVIGVFCIFAPSCIVKLLPYLMGIGMVVIGAFSIREWNRKRQKDDITTDLAYGLLLFIVGISFILQGQRSLFSMGIVWAMIGIRKASQTLIRFLYAVEHKNSYWFLAVEFFLRILLALLLLFDPYGKFTPHLRILGAELIVTYLGPAILSRRKRTSSDIEQ